MDVDAVTPPRVRRGDAVAVVAPAGPVPADRLRAGLDVLAPHFDLRVADDISRAEGYLAGSDARRADELNAVLRDPDVRAVWVARGGYGIMRILDMLDADALRADPVPIVGFSDATALLSWALCAGVRGIHGPVVTQLGRLGDDDRRWVVDLVTGQAGSGSVIAGLRSFGDWQAPAEGRLVGGNLSLLAHLVGTGYGVDGKGALFVLEDVGERPYAIDRYLTQLDLAGGLAGARAAVVGDFTRCEEKRIEGSPDAVAVARERLAAAGMGGVTRAPIGHGERNRAWPYGGAARLDSSELTLLEGAVS